MKEEKGLNSSEVKELQVKYGPNELQEQQLPGWWEILFSQFKSPLVYVLLLAGIVTLVLGHIPDTIIIFVAVLLNTVLGYFQESKAGKALQELKKFLTSDAEVIRDGKRVEVKTTEIVPGDTVILDQGDKVPADGKLIFANRAYFDEAIITGESMPLSKEVDADVFMGTTVSAGQARMEVVATGGNTKMGGIAEGIQEIKEDTPLKRQLTYFSKRLVIMVSALTAVVFLAGIWRGREIEEIFPTAVALAVSSIPEGLLVSLTVVLAIGMQRILKRKGLVRKLASAETLGSVTTICVDKTGTLTQGKMQVVEYLGDKKELGQQAILANDLDDPIVISAFEWGRSFIKDFIHEHPRLDSIPFSSKERFFVCLNQWSPKKNMLYVNGAPEVLLQWTNLSKKERDEINDKINELTSQGRRLIGFARKEVPKNKVTLTEDDAKSDLSWTGLLAFSDPVRPTVKEAFIKTLKAGIKVIVITGDYANTSEFVLKEVGIPVTPDEIIMGDEVERMTPKRLSEAVMKVKLFARTTPDQKDKIVKALRQNGEIVAMMGDGVNDAPAIHEADIGIAVSEASDVSKESADLILLDSDFATIVAAIEEGRGIFDNIRKIILYLLCDAFAEIIVVLVSILYGWPLPITAIQIIWINLVSDGFPGLALTIDPKRAGIMEEEPRSPDEPLINRWMISLIGIVSLIAGAISIGVFAITYQMTGDIIFARSMTFLTLGLNSLAYVFSVRSLMVHFWKSNIFENKWLLAAVGAGFFLQSIPFLTNGTREFFQVSKLSINHWLIAIGLSIVMFFAVETFKLIYEIKLVRKHLVKSGR